MNKQHGIRLATLLCCALSVGAMAAGQGGNMQGGQGMGSGQQGQMQQGQQGQQQGGRYGDFDRMNRLMEQMHRTNDPQSHYELMRQHWREMERSMEQLGREPSMDLPRDRLRDRDRTMEQLRDQMRLHQEEFDRMEYHRGMMR
ncbi:hypothetical protein [Marinobacterium lutimaris]|uniref:Zinc resistance-associated protein n=1 Tax=Marinobacterium lutimaris TaxID=568106 RepID=A0A1H6DSD2_9GAMM|nr:hypothetical protein [Marinobacterium lutimaris]SEG87623.1 hypothetical protein SAMN05444390_108109 [Marinobacterium lutimaris]